MNCYLCDKDLSTFHCTTECSDYHENLYTPCSSCACININYGSNDEFDIYFEQVIGIDMHFLMRLNGYNLCNECDDKMDKNIKIVTTNLDKLHEQLKSNIPKIVGIRKGILRKCLNFHKDLDNIIVEYLYE